MRRVAIVGSVSLAEPWAAWLGQMAAVSVRSAADLSEVELDATDLVWLVSPSTAAPSQLDPWLSRGGRFVVSGAGLGAVPGWRLWSPPAGEAPVGLAGWGRHPLFRGMDHGIRLAPTPAGWTLARAPVARCATAAAAWFVDRIEPGWAAAWEWSVGQGGGQALGLPLRLPLDPSLEIVLLNALLGDGVPHRDRGAAGCWPSPGIRAEPAPARPVPRVTAPAGLWPVPDEPSRTPEGPWSLAGRRMTLTGDGGGPVELRSQPVRLLHSPELLAAGERPEARSLTLWRGQVERRFGQPGPGELRSRWVVAAELPAALWDVASAVDEEVAGSALVDFAIPGVAPGPMGDLRFAASESATRVWIGSAGGPACVLAAEGARFTLSPGDGAAVRVRWSGRGGFRILIVAGTSAEDLERSLERHARRGVAGLMAQVHQHTLLVGGYGAQVESPDPDLDRRFADAKFEGDGALTEFPGIGRAPADSDGICSVAAAGTVAADLLGAGLRESAYDLLALLSLTQHASGWIAQRVLPAGVVEYGGLPALGRFLDLASEYLAWTGESDRLGRFRAALQRARQAGDRIVPTASRDDAGAYWSARARFAAAAAMLGLPPGARDDAAASGVDASRTADRPLARVIRGLWGIRPGAIGERVVIRPEIPPDWHQLRLRRLRVGRTVLDLEYRRRFGRAVLRIARTHGPSLPAEVGLAGPPPTAMSVDEVPLAGDQASFPIADRHEVTFHW